MQIKTNFIITCDQAFLTAASNNLNLIGIFSQINAQNFPAKHPRFALVANFDIDQLGDHTIETKILDPAGKQIAQAELPVKINTSPFQIITNFENLTFPAHGTYKIVLSLNGENIGSRVINLRTIVRHKANLA